MTNGIGRVGWRNFVPTNNPLWDNLKAYYTADNTANDSKGLYNTYNGTIMNGATYSTGKIGSAFSFDGVNDYMSTTETLTIDLNSPHTYSCWVNPSSGYSTKFFMSFSSMYGPSIGHVNGGYLTFFSGAVNGQVSSGKVLPLNTWSHVTVVFKGQTYGTGNVLFYVNGNLFSTVSLTFGGAVSAVPLYIGSNAGGSAQFFNGMLDELGIWGRELTAAEVAELYNGGAGKQYVAPAVTTTTSSIVTTGLVMSLDAGNTLSYSGTGTTWTDLSGNGNNGTLVNGTSYNSTYGGTLVFDGVNDYVDTNLITNQSAFSYGVWGKSNSSGFKNRIMGNADSTTGYNGADIIWGALGANTIYSVRRGGGNFDISSNIANFSGNWHYIVLTYDSVNGSKLYCDNVLVASNANTGLSSSLKLRIGKDGDGTDAFLGKIGAVQVYNKSLTSTEVATNFNASKSRYGF